MKIGVLLGLLLLISAELAALRRLQYSTSWIEGVSESDVGAPPTPDFRIGTLSWPVSEYAAEPALEPFRKEFSEHCRGTQGIDAALCAARALAARSPMGVPRHEFVDARYDPVAVLEEHLQGAPGHCVTRSSLIAAELLSVGIPARVVQFLPPSGEGHTILSVWDAGEGWTLMDPTVPGAVTRNGRATTAVQLLKDPSGVSVSRVGGAGTASVAASIALNTAEAALYPEPWLYMRVGPHAASWPFRGAFARIGAAPLTLGPLQKILVVCFAITMLVFVGTAGRVVSTALLHLRFRRFQEEDA